MTMVETFEGFSLLHSMTMQRMMSGAEQKELMNMMTDTVPIRLRDIWVVKQVRHAARAHHLATRLSAMTNAIRPLASHLCLYLSVFVRAS